MRAHSRGALPPPLWPTPSQERLRLALAAASRSRVPTPALSASLAYVDTLRSPKLPANLIQAQRDFFGQHGYTRVDKPDGQSFTTKHWVPPPPPPPVE